MMDLTHPLETYQEICYELYHDDIRKYSLQHRVSVFRSLYFSSSYIMIPLIVSQINIVNESLNLLHLQFSSEISCVLRRPTTFSRASPSLGNFQIYKNGSHSFQCPSLEAVSNDNNGTRPRFNQFFHYQNRK